MDVIFEFETLPSGLLDLEHFELLLGGERARIIDQHELDCVFFARELFKLGILKAFHLSLGIWPGVWQRNVHRV